jgi:fluoride exporter
MRGKYRDDRRAGPRDGMVSPVTPATPTLVLALALAGGLGTLARYAVALGATRIGWAAFPWGTLAVNVAGSAAFGLVWGLSEGGGRFSPGLKAVVLAGFLGGFTTFSAFAGEVAQMLTAGRYAAAGAYLLASNALAVAGVVLGIAVGRAV